MQEGIGEKQCRRWGCYKLGAGSRVTGEVPKNTSKGRRKVILVLAMSMVDLASTKRLHASGCGGLRCRSLRLLSCWGALEGPICISDKIILVNWIVENSSKDYYI